MSHERPRGADDLAVDAVGKLTEAMESVERARGSLFTFHQLTGKADFEVEEAAHLLRDAGHDDLAGRLERELVGRNVLPGRWTFQVVEEYGESYYQPFRTLEREVRDRVLDGRRHVFESELKEARRTRGRRGHEARPSEPVEPGGDDDDGAGAATGGE
ncbi:MAG: hypothetical protein ACR2LE_01450 [Nocardioidaceae bacterium]